MEVEEIVQRLRELKPELARRYKVRRLSVFGSWARGEQKEDSDIDLLVDFEVGADLLDLVGLSLYLEEVLGKSVDIVPRAALREELRETVLEQVISV